MQRPPRIVSGAPSDRLSGIAFQNSQLAKSLVSRLTNRISPSLVEALPALLSESPDPDSAVILFDRLISESTSEVTDLLNRHNFLAHYAIVIFGHSRFLGETLIQNSDILQAFLRERNLDLSFSHDDFEQNLSRFRARSFESDVPLLLARFKRREYLRIMLRDVLKIAPLAETTAEISALADVLIVEGLRNAASVLQRRHGTPQHLDGEGRLVDTHFSVLSLGKLGGNELNYSSDIDLLYIFGDGKEPSSAQITNREYFIRLAQLTTATLSEVTREGPVFRIDLRLRPQGNEGELAISLQTALRYYTSVAHDWERQALIKLRHSAGDIALAREFIRRVQPQVYGESEGEATGERSEHSDRSPDSGFRQQAEKPAGPLNFAAIKTALVARERMDRRREKRRISSASAAIDIKLDHGGIRDIEFLVQCLQRVYGGAEPWLRSGGTLFSLQKLHDKSHISGKEFHDLTSAYEFLRHLEHRLQLRQGQQTHQLPLAQSELNVLQSSMGGYAPQEYEIKDLISTVRGRMSGVAEIYRHIIYQEQSHIQKDSPGTGFSLKGEAESTEDQSTHQILDRLVRDAPALHEILKTPGLSPHGRANLFRFLSSAFTGSQRYAEVTRNSEVIAGAIGLFEYSDYLTDIVVRYPEEIETLAGIEKEISPKGGQHLFPPPVSWGHATADPVFEYLGTANHSYGEKLALLRKHFRHRVFAIGARDITTFGGVYECLESITAAAGHAISAAFAVAGNPDGLAAMAVGRLGSRELDVLSDADLVFVCAREKDRERLTKSAQQIMQALSAYTRDGMVFPVDTRLRPRGAAGELLVTPGQLVAYFQQESEAWEALTYTKLRFVAGSRELGDRVMSLTAALYQRHASDPDFLHAVHTMRDKLAATGGSAPNFKAFPGGTYDIDFLSGYLLIKHEIPNKQGTLRDRIWKCVAAKLLENRDAACLDHAAELLRTAEHVSRLTIGRVQKWLPAVEHARQVTENVTSNIVNRKFPEGLEAELLCTLREVRQIYNRVLV